MHNFPVKNDMFNTFDYIYIRIYNNRDEGFTHLLNIISLCTKCI